MARGAAQLEGAVASDVDGAREGALGATQLLNAGCRVTSIQRLLGHQRLNSTMIYARVHDRTVAEDYYAAMAQIEKSLDLAGEQAPVAGTGDVSVVMSAGERAQLLKLIGQLAELQLDPEVRMGLVEQIRRTLDPSGPGQVENLTDRNGQQHGPP
jgi:hypothetical protein